MLIWTNAILGISLTVGIDGFIRIPDDPERAGLTYLFIIGFVVNILRAFLSFVKIQADKKFQEVVYRDYPVFIRLTDFLLTMGVLICLLMMSFSVSLGQLLFLKRFSAWLFTSSVLFVSWDIIGVVFFPSIYKTVAHYSKIYKAFSIWYFLDVVWLVGSILIIASIHQAEYLLLGMHWDLRVVALCLFIIIILADIYKNREFYFQFCELET